MWRLTKDEFCLGLVARGSRIKRGKKDRQKEGKVGIHPVGDIFDIKVIFNKDCKDY